jgi:O-antigen ligase/cytochrome c-type biogenesis protein CcmH/NrfG
MARSKFAKTQPGAQKRHHASVIATEGSWVYPFGLSLVCAKVVMLPLVFDASLDMPFVVSKGLVSHGLAYLLAAALAALLLREGRRALAFSPLHYPVGAFVVASLIATVFAADGSLALFGTHARMLGLGSIVDLALLYLGVAFFVRTSIDATWLVISALAASPFVLAYEVIQLLGRDPFPWSIDSVQRPFSTLGQANALAQYLTTVASGTLALGVLANTLSSWRRVSLVLYSAVLLAGAAATGTRSAVVGLTVGGALLVLLVSRFHPHPRARLLSVLAAVTVSAVLAVTLFFTPLGARLASTFEPTGANDEEPARLEPSAAGRVALYEIAIQVVRERPLFGYGPDNFVVGVPRYRPEGAPDFIRQSLASSAHSWVGYVATSSGIVGLACFVAIVVVALVTVLRGGLRVPAAVGAVMLGAFLGTGFTTPNELGTEWLFWANAGAIAASTAHPTRLAQRQRQPRRDSHGGGQTTATGAAGVVLVAAAGVAVLFSWSALEASRFARSSQDARLGGRALQAVEFGSRATRSDPGRPAYWHVLGLAFVASSSWREAGAAFERAVALAPYDARYIGDLATLQLILANAGDTTARVRARDLGAQATQTDPNNPRAHLTRAVVLQVLGEPSEALRSVDRALQLDPRSVNDQLWLAATQINLDAGRPQDAVRIARDGLAIFGATRRTMPLRYELARALAAAGRTREAVDELNAALTIQPDDPSILRLRSQLEAGLPP